MDVHRDEALAAGLAGGRLTRRGALGRLGGAGVAAVAGAAAVRPALGQEADAGEVAGGRFPGDAGEAPGTPEDLVAPPLLFEELAAFEEGAAGRLRRLTDYDRNLWMDAGEGWRSVGGHVFDVRAYGAVGDGETDDWGAFDAAIEAMVSPLDADTTTPYGRTLLVPPGRYRLSQSLVLTRAVKIVGAVGSGPVGDAVLAPDAGITAIVVEGSDPPVRGRPGRRGFGATIEHLLIEAGRQEPRGAGSRDDAVHGVVLRARATLRDCAIAGFSGDGIHVADAGGDTAEVDRWAVDACQVVRCGEHGLYVGGGSAGVCSGLLAFENRKWGIFEESEGGNTYLHCRALGNGQGPYTSAAGNGSLFAGCASTGGQARSLFADETIVVGGDHAAGYEGGNAWVAAESRMLLRAQEPGAEGGDGGDRPLPTVPTLRIEGATGQTEAHLRIDDQGGGRLVEVDAPGRLLVGPAPLTPPPGGGPDAPDAVGLQPIQVQISHPESGQAGVRWVIAGDFVGWVAQARAILDVVGEGDGDAATALSRLTFQTPGAAGEEIDTLTLRQGRVGIGTAAPATAAILDLASASQGFLPPRLTREQRDAIARPPEGLTIYNRTTRRLNLFDGEVWQELGVAAVGG